MIPGFVNPFLNGVLSFFHSLIFEFIDIFYYLAVLIQFQIGEKGIRIWPTFYIIASNKLLYSHCALQIIMNVSHSKDGKFISFLFFIEFSFDGGKVFGKLVRVCLIAGDEDENAIVSYINSRVLL